MNKKFKNPLKNYIGYFFIRFNEKAVEVKILNSNKYSKKTLIHNID